VQHEAGIQIVVDSLLSLNTGNMILILMP